MDNLAVAIFPTFITIYLAIHFVFDFNVMLIQNTRRQNFVFFLMCNLFIFGTFLIASVFMLTSISFLFFMNILLMTFPIHLMLVTYQIKYLEKINPTV